jgi:hypothetical protein
MLTETCADVRAEVVKAAEEALLAAAMCTGNKDIEPFVPTLCSCVARPDEIGETVEKLAATTFVQAVEPPAMALMVPVLSRGLLDRATATKRKASVIIDNMCKLVTEPRFAKAFLPKLRPDLVSGWAGPGGLRLRGVRRHQHQRGSLQCRAVPCFVCVVAPSTHAHTQNSTQRHPTRRTRAHPHHFKHTHTHTHTHART